MKNALALLQSSMDGGTWFHFPPVDGRIHEFVFGRPQLFGQAAGIVMPQDLRGGSRWGIRSGIINRKC